MKHIWESLVWRWNAASRVGKIWAATMLAVAIWWIHTGRPEAWTLAFLYLVILAQAAELNFQTKAEQGSRRFVRMGRMVAEAMEEVERGEDEADMIMIRPNAQGTWVLEKW